MLQRKWEGLCQRLGDPLLDLIVDTSTRCNLRCRMCVLAEYGDHRDMTLATFRVLKDALRRVKHISFTCSGEPLLNRQIGEIVALARGSSSARLSLITNGTLLDEVMARTLIQVGLDELTVSLDGATPPTYENIRRGARFAETIRNIRVWNELSQRELAKNGGRRIRLRLGFVAMRGNITELPAMPGLARDLGAEEVQVNGLEPYAADCAEEILYGPQARNYAGYFAKAAANARALGVSLRLPVLELGPGRKCWPMPHVAWDGTVRPCGALVYHRPFYFLGQREEHSVSVMGDAIDEGFLGVWRTASYRAFRRQIRRKRFPDVCHRCLLSYGVIC